MKKITAYEKPTSKIKTQQYQKARIVLSFEDFSFKCINIQKKFNNHYKDKDDFLRTTLAVFRLLNKLSQSDLATLSSNGAFCSQFHIHAIGNNTLIFDILHAYGFSDIIINEKFGELYQIEPLGSGGSTRLIYWKADNIIHPLFLDNNHHIYKNKSMIGESLSYNFCPLNNCMCDAQINNQLELTDCILGEFFDSVKYEETFNNNYQPQ